MTRLVHISIVAAARAGRIELPQPKTPAQAQACLRGLVRMGLAKGRLSVAERRALFAFGARVKLPPSQVRFVFKTERSGAHLRAKAALAARGAAPAT